MVATTADMKTRLMEEDAEFKHMVEKHRLLDKQIEDLDQQILLTTEQKMETVTLKKKKLHIKDLIGARLAHYSQSLG
jgi:uncharacterized protein YdcH (DUF465 family)